MAFVGRLTAGGEGLLLEGSDESLEVGQRLVQAGHGFLPFVVGGLLLFGDGLVEGGAAGGALVGMTTLVLLELSAGRPQRLQPAGVVFFAEELDLCGWDM